MAEKTSTAMEVHDRAEVRGERRAMLDMQAEREARTIELRDRPGFDLADVDETEFEKGLAKLKLRQQRLQRILDTSLLQGVHYGNPVDRNGNPVFKKPMLYQAGAEELRKLFRLSPVRVGDPLIIADDKFVSVTATMAVQDSMGRTLAVRSGSCNTLEKRFEGRGGGRIFKDPRETIHVCLTMAEKRALTLATRDATGATAFFCAEEEMNEALAPQPWTEEEKKQVIAVARKAGLKTRGELKALAVEVLGSEFVGTGEDVAQLLTALEQRRQKQENDDLLPEDEPTDQEKK